MSRLVSGERGLRIEALESLADYLGYEVIMYPRLAQTIRLRDTESGMAFTPIRMLRKATGEFGFRIVHPSSNRAADDEVTCSERRVAEALEAGHRVRCVPSDDSRAQRNGMAIGGKRGLVLERVLRTRSDGR